ncbi:MAG: hypothetical protein FGM26_11025 [Beijerinckiaceae bacterium]|nr:hypothetical protein [Beijerinckiaceae bacterium]
MKRWAQLISITLISLVWHASGALLAPDRAEARGVRGPRMATRPMKPPRMKTYRFNGKDIYGYRNFVRQRREAKLASGGFKMRKDGSVVHKDMHIRVGRYSKKSPLRPMPNGPAEGTVLGQCRNGASITSGNIDWACRDAGGISWSHQPPRISGIRDY